jgi:hypothetical protein
MAKVTLMLCDVKPCTSKADREFEVNGRTLNVCGAQCFTRFWNREYANWNESLYRLQTTFRHLTATQEHHTQEVSEFAAALLASGSLMGTLET